MRVRYIVALIVVLFLPLSAGAKSNVLFILDGSNSMWGQIGGEAKITSAQNVLGGLLKDFDADTDLGFITYGHREESSCKDIEVLSGIGEMSSDALIGKINAIKPKGKTPIAGALAESLNVLAKYEGDNNSVVLISDGVETCGGDPCAAAKALADAGIEARVHVVGFDIGAEERKQLECIPAMGNGKYFSASNASELKVAVAEVKKEAVKPVSVAKQYFRDDFDGDKLAEHWEVANPDLDAYIVENGSLTVVLTDTKQPGPENIPNIFWLSKPIPEGDWVLSMSMNATPQTMAEWLTVGLAKRDFEKQLVTSLQMYTPSYAVTKLNIRGDSVSKKTTSFVETIYEERDRNTAVRSQKFKDRIKSVTLRLEKKGRQYIASGKLVPVDPEDKTFPNDWFVLPRLTSLRLPGDAFFMRFYSSVVNDYLPATGEGVIEVDWIKIEVIEEGE